MLENRQLTQITFINMCICITRTSLVVPGTKPRVLYVYHDIPYGVPWG